MILLTPNRIDNAPGEAVSFGFVWAPSIDKLKVELARNRERLAARTAGEQSAGEGAPAG